MNGKITYSHLHNSLEIDFLCEGPDEVSTLIEVLESQKDMMVKVRERDVSVQTLRGASNEQNMVRESETKSRYVEKGIG